ncbi:hypothetical protein EYF80_033323 [Liparis tanakae]|uniref:Uncharacterized protein n=1 Tax=Liparis tanakae TaxID=230148 RepID=A0A4Z2GUM7_9TELE|nr:hypothetical protein EYF80_033323 [Liparis tanakae]
MAPLACGHSVGHFGSRLKPLRNYLRDLSFKFGAEIPPPASQTEMEEEVERNGCGCTVDQPEEVSTGMYNSMENILLKTSSSTSTRIHITWPAGDERIPVSCE